MLSRSPIISTQMTARRALAPMTMNRRPPRMRSRAGPIRGATTANGAIVSARYSATLLRAALGSMSKNSELASARAMRVSPATAAAWVRASRVNGVTTNALAPSRRFGLESGSHPLSSAITSEGTSPSRPGGAARAGGNEPGTWPRTPGTSGLYDARGVSYL